MIQKQLVCLCLYRANIWALKEAGCTHIIASTASGSLKEEIKPGDLVIVDTFIDQTRHRKLTLHDGSTPGCPTGILHLPMEPAFCPEVRDILMETAKELGIHFHPNGTAVVVEGPRFSSKAESNMFRSWGASLVNMTLVPEVISKLRCIFRVLCGIRIFYCEFTL
jgi:5'-methylthioadenosine phosphorylase